MQTIAFYTLGCKLNQAESEELAAVFRARGFKTAAGAERLTADAAVVNTCTVTSKAEQKSRRLIRNLLCAPARPFVFVTGCYARLNKSEIEALDLCRHKDRRLFVIETACDIVEILGGGAEPAAGNAPLRSRTFIKIQDGCNNACSYCRVRLARGRAGGENSENILERIAALEEAGAAEAVLVGVNISQYRDNQFELAGLLRFLMEHTRSIALRLASLEPSVFTEDFFDVVQAKRIRPHFHISVQSASDTVLAGMRRRGYNAESLLKIIARLRAIRHDIRNDPFIACDIIAGFPGEGEAEFKETFDFCVSADFAWIHAFPYSPRPGTEAASPEFLKNMPRVQESVARNRVERLIELANKGSKNYARRWKGQAVEAAAETDGTFTTENYLKIKRTVRGVAPGQRTVITI